MTGFLCRLAWALKYTAMARLHGLSLGCSPYVMMSKNRSVSTNQTDPTFWGRPCTFFIVILKKKKKNYAPTDPYFVKKKS